MTTLEKIAETQMRATYYRILIEVNKLRPSVAFEHTQNATIEDMETHILANERSL